MTAGCPVWWPDEISARGGGEDLPSRVWSTGGTFTPDTIISMQIAV